MRDEDSKRFLWRLPKLETADWGKMGPGFGYGIGCGIGVGAGVVGGFFFLPLSPSHSVVKFFCGLVTDGQDFLDSCSGGLLFVMSECSELG